MFLLILYPYKDRNTARFVFTYSLAAATEMYILVHRTYSLFILFLRETPFIFPSIGFSFVFVYTRATTTTKK